MSSTNVVTLHPPTEPLEDEKRKRGVDARWGARLGKHFTPISSYFLQNAYRLKPLGMPKAKGLSPSETLALVHLFDHQWDERDAYPSLQTIADRMSLSRRQVRDIMKRLEDLKLLTRIRGPLGGTNRYNLTPLKKRLEQLMDDDIAASDAAIFEALAAAEKEQS